MNNVKGFVAIPELANNNDGVTAAFGELSTYAQSFSRHKGNYVATAKPDVELVTFSSKDGANAYHVLPDAVALHVLSVGQWIRDQYTTDMIPLNTSKAAFITGLEAEFPTISNTAIGELVAGATALKNMPDYIQWEYTHVATSTTYTFKVWFIDSRFRGQYDEYEIVVIPPVTVVDDLNNNTATVSALLDSLTAFSIVQKIQTVVGTNPPTLVKPKNYQWHDPTLTASTLPSTWTMVIYGAAGDNADNIRQAVLDYIAANSALGVWPTIYPDLYTENEFVVMPLWENIAIPASGLDYGLYSPVANPTTYAAIATLFLPASYASSVVLATYLNLYLNSAAAFYRSVGFLALGNPNNSGGVFSFLQKFPDYMLLPTLDPDFARMELNTQQFIIKLNEAFNHAFEMTPTSTVPVGFSRVLRDTKIYTAFDHDGTTYLVLTKYTYNLLTP